MPSCLFFLPDHVSSDIILSSQLIIILISARWGRPGGWLDKAKKTGMGDKCDETEPVHDANNNNLVGDKNNKASQISVSIKTQNDSKSNRSDNKNWRDRTDSEDQLNKPSVDSPEIAVKSESTSPLCVDAEKTPVANCLKDLQDSLTSFVQANECLIQSQVKSELRGLPDSQMDRISLAIKGRGRRSNLPGETVAPGGKSAVGLDRTIPASPISPTAPSSLSVLDSSDSSVPQVKKDSNSLVAEQSNLTESSVVQKQLGTYSTSLNNLAPADLPRPPLKEIQTAVIKSPHGKESPHSKESVELENKTTENEKLETKSPGTTSNHVSKKIAYPSPRLPLRPVTANYSGK